MFKQEEHTENYKFTWDALGNLAIGRQHLGESMPVVVYRILEYSMREVLEAQFGKEKAIEVFQQAGYVAGREFANNALDLSLELNPLMGEIQRIFRELKMGIFRVERVSTDGIYLTVEEDLDCSGLPVTGETVCYYDEGFIKGILEQYSHEKYIVKEIDCWSTGARVCRFRCQVSEEVESE